MAVSSRVNSTQSLAASNLYRRGADAIAEIRRGDCDRAVAQRSALFAFAVRTISAGIAYFSQVLLARWMGSFEYGIFVFVWIWVLILGGLIPIGLNTSVIRFIPEYEQHTKHALIRGLLFGNRILSICVGTGVALIGTAGLYIFSDQIENHYILPIYLALICLPLYALSEVQDGIARAFGWLDLALIPLYIMRPLLLLITMGGAYIAGLEMTAVTAAGAAILATWACGIIQLIFLNHRTKRRIKPGRREYQYDLWIKTSLPILLIEGFDIFLQNTDVIVLSAFYSPSDVAVYFAALKTMSLIVFVRFAVSAAVAHRFSAHHASGDQEQLASVIRDAVHWTFWPSLAGAIAILALGYPLLSLFGSDFTAGYPAMFVLAVGFLIRAAMGPAEYLLNMLGEQKACAGVLFSSAVLNLVLNILLIPPLGLLGAASATAMSLILASLLFFIVAKRRLGLDISIRQKNSPH